MVPKRLLLEACSIFALALLAAGCSSTDDDQGYYADPESVAPPIDAQAFWMERREGHRLEQLLVGEAVPTARRYPRDPELLTTDRSFRKIATNGEMHHLVASMKEAGFDRLAQAAPAPGAIQVVGLVLGDQVRYVSILPPRNLEDIENMSDDERAAREVRAAFLDAYSRVHYLDAGTMTKEEFDQVKQRLKERNEQRLKEHNLKLDPKRDR
ncbi:MAG: hypothetical protein H6834_11780 [Planctomycetes bacterium]|nr:hypothetical protein [Planctomycetota bacterium]